MGDNPPETGYYKYVVKIIVHGAGMDKALFFQQGDGQQVFCHLCAHGCRIKAGKTGICGVRKNIDGILYPLTYGRVIAGNVDPVEKKPFSHICPGSLAYSIATVGCNFKCLNCQNYQISQFSDASHDVPGRDTTPEEVVENAVRSGCASVAYTYTEPTVYYEFSYDTARLAKDRGLYNLYVTNGFMTSEAAVRISEVLDGANVDLKSFSDGFYRKICKGRLSPVLNTIRLLKKHGVWVEVTTLVIPGMNDTDEELQQIAGFIKTTDPGIPWHVSAFHPTYKMADTRPTPAETLKRVRDIGLDSGLRYVYTGNVKISDAENTYCYNCGQAVVIRSRYSVVDNRLKKGCCPECGTQIDGIWERL